MNSDREVKVEVRKKKVADKVISTPVEGLRDASPRATTVRFAGDRAAVRHQAALFALQGAWDLLPD